MGYTTPKTWGNEAVFAGDMNIYLRDNFKALKYPPTAYYLIDRDTDYSTTSTSFTDIHSTEMALSITLDVESDVMLGLQCVLYSSSSIRIYLRVDVDGSPLQADDGLLVSEASGVRTICPMLLIPALAAGEHTFKMQWKVSSGTGVMNSGAGTSGRDTKGLFWVRVMS